MLLSVATETANPIIPTAWELMVIVAGAVVAALFICAMINIARSKNYTPAGRALWLLIVCTLPALGPLLWFLIGRTPSPTRRSVPSRKAERLVPPGP